MVIYYGNFGHVIGLCSTCKKVIPMRVPVIRLQGTCRVILGSKFQYQTPFPHRALGFP